MGRKRARPKASAKVDAAQLDVRSQEEEKDEQETSDASTRTPSAKRKSRSGEKSTASVADKELGSLSTEGGDKAVRTDIGISIGGTSDAFLDKVASRLPGRRAQVTVLARLLDEVRTYVPARLVA